jgi:hypothetical protein
MNHFNLKWLRRRPLIACLSLLALCLSPMLRAQTTSVISGTVKDSTGAIVPNASITLINTLTNTSNATTSNGDGVYSFPGLVAGQYQLEAKAAGFQGFTQKGIVLELSQAARVDVALKLGSVTSEVVVNANASPLSLDTVTQEFDISPEVERKLPLLVSGAPSNAYTFAAILPGVASNNGTSNPSQISINGGTVQGQEAITDGISMQEGALSQGGTIGFGDFPMSPDIISEVKVLTSNYGPQYGGTAGGVIIQSTKSGTKDFHGNAYEYLRNTDLNATRFGQAQRSPDNEHQFGGSVGGPIKLPIAWTSHNKTYFFFNYEQYQQLGGVNPPVLTIPSLKNRSGDFTDQVNAQGGLIPIFDPTTTAVVNGVVTRKQFMGCDGNTPNVICANRLSPIALAFYKFLPTPTNNAPVNNYQVPKALPDAILEGTKQLFGKVDEYIGQSDHVALTIWFQTAPQKFNSELPRQLSFDQLFGAPENSWVDRLNWDHTFSLSVLNHFAFGYLNRNEGEGSQNYSYVNDLPQIPGVADSSNSPPQINEGGYAQFGRADGDPRLQIGSRPTYIGNDLVTVIKGKHSISFGGEFRYLTSHQTTASNEAGTFSFGTSQTGLFGIPSGNEAASFLLGAVGSASSTYYSIHHLDGRQHAVAVYAGDVWKVAPNLTLNYGLRWQFWSPGSEANGNNAWLDLSRPNPDAGNLPGSLVFGTPRAGAAYAGKYAAENPFYKGFAPRLGFIFVPELKTTVTLGYGITFDQLFYTDYSASAGEQAGFNNTASYSSTGNGGLDPAFYLSQGFPGNTQPVPDFSLGLVNGRDNYNGDPWRNPKDGRLPYSQQWNLTIQHSLGNNTLVSAAYIGAKGTHLYSSVSPQNALNPSLLSLGSRLYDTFAPGQTELDGVAAPYQGWAAQMQNCAPTVAQALLPYPQYCQPLGSLTESDGYSIYHSLQLSMQKRYTKGFFILANYTWSKLMGTPGNEFGSVIHNYVFSPYQKQRYYTLNQGDLPSVFNLASTYTLPFGKSERFLNQGGVLNALVGGWETSGILHINSGNLLSFGAGCNYPGQFQAYGCFPDLVAGQKIKAADQGTINHAIATGASYSAFNAGAFVGADFPTPYEYPDFTITNGPEFPKSARGFYYSDTDISLTKGFTVVKGVKVLVGGQFFNIFNQHSLGNNFGGGLTGTNFGQWTGGVTNPRNGQITGRIEF